jgi:small basic protein (TIGR04137 family)
MTMDKSLRVRKGSSSARGVLSRGERILKLKEQERWEEGRSPLGLPKVRVVKTAMKKKKVKKEEGDAAAAGGKAAAGAKKKKATSSSCVPVLLGLPAAWLRSADRCGRCLSRGDHLRNAYAFVGGSRDRQTTMGRHLTLDRGRAVGMAHGV